MFSGRVSNCINIGDQDILQPIVDSASPTGVVQILSYHILHHQIENWDQRSVFGTLLAVVSGYRDWTHYHLWIYYNILKRANIYQAIYTSLFDYGCLSFSWICEIAEYWDKTTNTCCIDLYELTFTLADMQDITYIPILELHMKNTSHLIMNSFSIRSLTGKEEGVLYTTQIYILLQLIVKNFSTSEEP